MILVDFSFSGKVFLKRPLVSDNGKTCLCMFIVKVLGRQWFKLFSLETELKVIMIVLVGRWS